MYIHVCVQCTCAFMLVWHWSMDKMNKPVKFSPPPHAIFCKKHSCQIVNSLSRNAHIYFIFGILIIFFFDTVVSQRGYRNLFPKYAIISTSQRKHGTTFHTLSQVSIVLIALYNDFISTLFLFLEWSNQDWLKQELNPWPLNYCTVLHLQCGSEQNWCWGLIVTIRTVYFVHLVIICKML